MWHIVLSRETGKEELKKAHTDVHRQWLTDQHRAGRILFLGPTADHAYGIYIMLASNRSEAEHSAAQDPFHVWNTASENLMSGFRVQIPGGSLQIVMWLLCGRATFAVRPLLHQTRLMA